MTSQKLTKSESDSKGDSREPNHHTKDICDKAKIFTVENLVDIKERQREMKRGDIVVVTEKSKIWKKYIYDGEKLVSISPDDNSDPEGFSLDGIPKEYPSITEFPIQYWSQDCYIPLYFDYRPYERQIVDNYQINDDLGEISSLHEPKQYGWTSFKIQWFELINKESSDLSGKLIPVLDKIVADYLEETYYIIYLPLFCHCSKKIFTESLEDTIENHNIAFFTAGTTYEISPKMNELKDYILYMR